MHALAKHVPAAALATMSFLGLAVTVAQAQENNNPNFKVGGGTSTGQAPGNGAGTVGDAFPNASRAGTIRSTQRSSNPYFQPPYAPIQQPSMTPGMATVTSSPYGQTMSSFNPYMGGGFGNPYFPSLIPDFAGGFLRGVADVTMANAQYQVTIQQARLAQSQADMSKIDLRRRIFDEARYERMMTPTPEDVRINDMVTSLNRARRDPPLTEIWSGKALNDLFTYVSGMQSKGMRGPNIALDEDLLKRINVTTGTGGSVGLLKEGAKLQWPLSLQGGEFDKDRKSLTNLMQEVVQQAKFNNPVSPAMLKDMQADLRRLNDQVTDLGRRGDLAPSQFIEAKRYLSHLEDAVKALQDPNVSNYFTQKWTARGKTVAELIKNMSDQGLKFAPAAPGDEFAYRALHQSLAAYDAGMAQLMATQPRPE